MKAPEAQRESIDGSRLPPAPQSLAGRAESNGVTLQHRRRAKDWLVGKGLRAAESRRPLQKFKVSQVPIVSPMVCQQNMQHPSLARTGIGSAEGGGGVGAAKAKKQRATIRLRENLRALSTRVIARDHDQGWVEWSVGEGLFLQLSAAATIFSELGEHTYSQ